MKIFNIKEYGAIGDGITDDAEAIQKAIDACNEAGGGCVYLPAGHTFLSGPFSLKSYIEFYVQSGATLLANPDENVYKESAFRENKGEGTIWIGGENIKQVVLNGTGIIDGNGVSFMGKELPGSYELKPFDTVDPRPHVVTIVGGNNLKIQNLTFKNAAYWTLHLIGCEDVAISDITLLNSLKVRNSDGIDLDHSRNVRIANCHIESGDDCICIKNRREYAEFGPCENITVTGCTMVSTSCAIKIGSENMDRISHVTFTNCIIKDSNRGIGIQHRDEGSVENILFSNILIDCRHFPDEWWGKSEPIYVTAFRRAFNNHKDANIRFPKNAKKGKVGTVRNIYFSNIKCKSENGIYVSAESSDKIINVRFNNIDIEIDKITKYPGGVYDRRPCEAEGMVYERTSGFFFENATGITVSECSVAWGENKPAYFGYALESKNVEELDIQNLKGTAAFPHADPSMKIHDGEIFLEQEKIA